MSFFRLSLCVAWLVCFTASGQEHAPKRYALLLGNAAYAKLPPVPAVKREVASINAALKDAGFAVTMIEDANVRGLVDAMPAFLAKLSPGDVCFFYYSGYVMQSSGDNYLLPVDFNPAAQGDISRRAPSLASVWQSIDDKKAGLKIIAMEARQDPSLLAGGIGLATPDASGTDQILFAFSASPNQPLPDASAREGGAFTRSLGAALKKPGLRVEDVFQDAKREAVKAFLLPNLTETFYFHEPEKPKVVDSRLTAGALSNKADRQEYVWIPAGNFKMGCVPADKKCLPEEKPQHQVTISHGFWMGRTEVTIDSYARYVALDKKTRKMPKKPDFKTDGNHPITMVAWNDAAAFCGFAGGRLPTEAEWEYAARVGKDDEIYPLNDENSRDKANFDGKKGNDVYEFTAPVGKFDRSEWGLFDMAGNVWEWCLDWFSKTYFTEQPITDPKGPATGTKHVARGGSWFSDPKKHLRLSYRDGFDAGNNIGFRCVLEDGAATDGLLGR